MKFRSSRGQSLVEFTLSAFLLIMILIGVVEIGRLILVYTTISNAVRAGVRYAVVHGSDNSDTNVTNVTTSYLSAAPMNTANVRLGVCYGTFASITACACPASGQNVSGTPGAIGTAVAVQACYPYDPFTAYFLPSITLSSYSEGVIAF